MIAYWLVLHRVRISLVCLFLTFLIGLVLGITPSLPVLVAGLLLVTFVPFYAIAYLENRGGYVPEEKRVRFVETILGPKLRKLVKSLVDETRYAGEGPSCADIKGVLRDFWAVYVEYAGITPTVKALIELERSFEPDGVGLKLGESTRNYVGDRVSRHPCLTIWRQGELLLNTDGESA